MNVKRYLADDVPEAMEKIRTELGRDAFILNTRKIRRRGLSGLFQKPLVEVVAAYDNLPPAPARKMPPPPVIPVAPIAPAVPPAHAISEFQPYILQDVITGARVAAPVAPPPEREQIHNLENKLDSLSNTLTHMMSKMQSKGGFQGQSYPPEVEGLVLSLLEQEVHEEFAHKIGREVAGIVSRESEDVRDVMEQLVRQSLGDPAPIKLKRYKRTVVLFVGPTGVGKTTTLAKLAAIYSLNPHARVGIITTDTYRIAAVDQLKTYAEILEVPLTVVYAPEDITEALRAFEDRDVVFVDTAGKSPNDATLESEISALLRYSEADEVHLVMSATTSFAGCLNIVGTYSFLREYKLLLTKMDETPSWGMAVNLKYLTDRSISYMAAGQNVPDDIEVFNAKKVAAHLLGE